MNQAYCARSLTTHTRCTVRTWCCGGAPRVSAQAGVGAELGAAACLAVDVFPVVEVDAVEVAQHSHHRGDADPAGHQQQPRVALVLQRLAVHQPSGQGEVSDGSCAVQRGAERSSALTSLP